MLAGPHRGNDMRSPWLACSHVSRRALEYYLRVNIFNDLQLIELCTVLFIRGHRAFCFFCLKQTLEVKTRRGYRRAPVVDAGNYSRLDAVLAV